MPWFEDKLRPAAPPRAWMRDTVGVGLVLAVLLVLRPRWQLDAERYVTDVMGQVFPFFLLPVLGMALALRRGAIDLSVWIVAGLGGVVAAGCVCSGVGLVPAALIAAGAGLAVGAVNGAIVALLRVPSGVVTIATALVCMWGLQAVADAGGVDLPPRATDAWHMTQAAESDPTARQPGGHEMQWLPLAVTRAFFVAGVFVVVLMGALAGAGTVRLDRFLSERWLLFGVLCVSGVLASLGGVAWLIERGAAPVPARPVGELRILAAVALAGPYLLSRHGRTPLVVICVPPAVLAATLWRQHAWAWDLHYGGYALQVLQLTAMVLLAHAAVAKAIDSAGRFGWRIAVAGMATAGLLLTATAGRGGPLERITALYVVGAATALLAAAMWLAAGGVRLIAARR
ncbi:MAG: hypothetical protein KGY99_02355 [Phycisphaerae bacterium]|nr:hypothetical protein [Phycisphaerae bacterium]